MDWSDDGNNEQLYRLMDKYEGWGSDYEEINELILKKARCFFEWDYNIFRYVLCYRYLPYMIL